MNENLLSLVQQALGGDFSKLASQFLGESQGATQSALSSLLPAVLGSIAHKGATPEGATGLMSLINGANLDVSSLGDIAGLLAGGGAGMNTMLKSSTNSLVPALFGDKSGAVVNALSATSGIKNSSAVSLLAMSVPLVLTVLKKFIGDKGLSASSLAPLLASQGPNLQGLLDSRMTGALGFVSPGALLSGLSGQTAVAGGTTAAAAVTGSGLMRWLPWLVGAGVVLILWVLWSGKSTPTLAPMPTASAPATTTMPEAVAASLLTKVYFNVGEATLSASANTQIAAVADVVKKDQLKVIVTGYTDKTGDMATNEALAKRRAEAVSNALKAAGVEETSIEMKPPMFVETGAATGSDAEARRVEISKR